MKKDELDMQKLNKIFLQMTQSGEMKSSVDGISLKVSECTARWIDKGTLADAKRTK
jgi:hypothetical protein